LDGWRRRKKIIDHAPAFPALENQLLAGMENLVCFEPSDCSFYFFIIGDIQLNLSTLVNGMSGSIAFMYIFSFLSALYPTRDS